MKENQEPRAAIYVEETYTYDVELEAISEVKLTDRKGSIRIKIPYDGAHLEDVSTDEATYHAGDLQIAFPDTLDNKEILPVKIPAGLQLLSYIKSSKRAVVSAEYVVPEPQSTLITVSGEVFDKAEKELVLRGLDPFSNALNLRISLWVPDLLAQSKTDKTRELETMLLWGENTQQVFMKGASYSLSSFEQELAQNLAALANSSGGAILIGVDRGGKVTGLSTLLDNDRQLEKRLLRSALRCTPPVPALPPRYIKSADGKKVVQIVVPGGDETIYQLNGVVYKRVGRKTVSEQAEPADLQASSRSTLLVSDLADILDVDDEGNTVLKSGEDIVVRSAIGGLDALNLGCYICGLLNSEQRNSHIIITDLSFLTPRPVIDIWPFRYRRRSALRQLRSYLEQEVARLLPRPDLPPIQLSQIKEHQVAILNIPKSEAPVTLYDGRGHLWAHPALHEMSTQDALQRYWVFSGVENFKTNNHNAAQLDYAWLERSIRPPVVIGNAKTVQAEAGGAAEKEMDEKASYDTQSRAYVWKPRAFIRQEDTEGFFYQLVAPLRHISLTLGDNGAVTVTQPILAKGLIVVRFDDVLASGIEIAQNGSDKDEKNKDKKNLLNSLPIIKRTYLRLNFTAKLNELFRRRTRTSLLQFHIHDVILDSDRLEDLTQACADLGFRICAVDTLMSFDENPQQAIVRIQGIRSRSYDDIFLAIIVVCQRSDIMRELRYEEQRIDSKNTYTGMLTIKMALWGTGGNVSREIEQAQIELYETINKRLYHLHSE